MTLMKRGVTKGTRGILAAALAAATIACASEAKTPAPPAEAPKVQVVAAGTRDVPLETTFTGRVEPIHRVELRARVGGALDAVLFKEGATVPAGTPLFRIDQRPFQIALQRAKAEAAAIAAQLNRARDELARGERLAASDAIPGEELERRKAEVAAFTARLATAQATVADAELNLEFTVVRAPVSGRIGRAEVTKGNLVMGGPAGGTRLALLQSMDPIHVYFDLDPATAAAARQTTRARWTASVAALDGGASVTGPVDFVDTGVGDQTGTLKVRARLANAPGHLLPSSVVRVNFRYGTSPGAVVIPDLAVGTEQGTRFVLVAGDNGTVEYRPVTLGARVGDHRVVQSGVRSGELIVLPGLPWLRPGMTIVPVQEEK